MIAIGVHVLRLMLYFLVHIVMETGNLDEEVASLQAIFGLNSVIVSKNNVLTLVTEELRITFSIPSECAHILAFTTILIHTLLLEI